ncbi:hypothetical protein [Mycobacterium sp. E2497]|uniref:hypothetical protein n=1 Tax=Mycobacterium sp. E2497 TaxID=1834135 RepID=UPI0007FF8DB6|nr:hypothetical protein A5713_07615 [Mycobacterium sp. E2497]
MKVMVAATLAGLAVGATAAALAVGTLVTTALDRPDDADGRAATADTEFLCVDRPISLPDNPLAPADNVPTAGCQGGWSPWGGGTYCDGNPYPDGSYDHCVSVSVLGWGGTQCYRVCPPDPANPAVPLGWTPGMVCPFRP